MQDIAKQSLASTMILLSFSEEQLGATNEISQSAENLDKIAKELEDGVKVFRL